MNFEQYINAELLILVPVLYLIGEAIKKTEIKHKYIPFILGGISIVFCGVYVFAGAPVIGSQEVATAFFTAVTQGVLIAGTAVYANQLVKQAREDD